MEENDMQMTVTERIDNFLIGHRRTPALKKAAARLAALRKKELPTGRGFVTGITAGAALQVKAEILLFCAGMMALFGLLVRHVWVLYGVLFCAALAGILWGIAVWKQKKSPMVLYDNRTVCILLPKETVRLSYRDIQEVHVLEDRLALVTKEKTWIFTAETGENLKEMQAFMNVLGVQCPGRTFTASDET